MMYISQDIDSILEVSRIITIHYFIFDKDFSYCGESHDFWEIVYADKGDVLATAGEQELKLRQGEMIFHKPNEYHNLRADGIAPANVFIVAFACNCAVMKHFESYRAKAPASAILHIRRILEEGQKAFCIRHSNPYMREMVKKQNAPIWSQQLIKLSLEQLLLELLRRDAASADSHSAKERRSRQTQLTGRIISYMERHVDENITIEDICREVSYGKTYVCTVFSRDTGLTLMQYFTGLKMERAKQLMRDTGENTAEISARLSYNNPQYFYRIFKKTTGMTAKEYRNRYAGN